MLRGIAAYVRRHHIALLALFFALGGTAFAAGNALLPKNSVGSAQVINGSLQKGDLSGRAVAALKGNRGLKGAQGTPGAAGPQGPAGQQGVQGVQGPPGAAATNLWAVVDGAGTTAALTRGSGVTNTEWIGTGEYRITFNRSMSNCTYLATLGSVATGFFTTPGEISTGQSGSDPNAVLIFTRNSAGTVVNDLDFHLAVFC
jgi:hypothetical protein